MKRIHKISGLVFASLLIPFIFMSLFVTMFALVGVSVMDENNHDEFNDMGGAQFWFNFVFVFSIMNLLVLIVSLVYVLTCEQKKKKQELN